MDSYCWVAGGVVNKVLVKGRTEDNKPLTCYQCDWDKPSTRLCMNDRGRRNVWTKAFIWMCGYRAGTSRSLLTSPQTSFKNITNQIKSPNQPQRKSNLRVPMSTAPHIDARKASIVVWEHKCLKYIPPSQMRRRFSLLENLQNSSWSILFADLNIIYAFEKCLLKYKACEFRNKRFVWALWMMLLFFAE